MDVDAAVAAAARANPPKRTSIGRQNIHSHTHRAYRNTCPLRDGRTSSDKVYPQGTLQHMSLKGRADFVR